MKLNLLGRLGGWRRTLARGGRGLSRRSESHNRRLTVEALESRTLLSAATINWATQQQTIAGFGASCAWYWGSFTASQQQLLWSPTNGAGLSILRGQIDCNTTGTSDDGESTIMQEAQRMGVTIFSTPWSPPAAWKSNNNTVNGGTLLAADYQNYATWLANYVMYMKSQYGVTVYGVSMQNESDFATPDDYSCVWTASEFDTVLFNYLEPTFAADGISSTKIILPEQIHWGSLDLVSTVLSDSRLSQYSNIIFADHTYGDVSTNSPITGLGGNPIWETEHTGDNPNIGIQCALDQAENIYHVIGQNQASAYCYWWINSGGGGGLLDGNWGSTYNTAAMENYSKFIRPGWVQVGESNSDSLQISAYKNPNTGDFATVLINSTSSPITETINLNGAYSPVITPWVTSATLSVAQQQSIPATGNGGSYTYTVPAQSIVTLTGTATTTAVTASPVGLLASATSTSSIALSWTNNLSSATYTVQRSPDGTNWTTLASGLSSSTYSYTNSGLTANTQYYYRIQASNGAYSNVVAQMTQPPAPTNLTASYSASTQNVTLNWTGNGSSATDYEVDVSTDGGTTWTIQNAGISSGTTSYTDTNAPDLATCTYRVRAIYGTNSSVPTNIVTLTTTVLKAPTAPSSGLAAALDSNGKSIDLSWTDNTWPRTGTTVSIERSTDGTNWTVIASVANGTQAYTDSATAEGGTYYYRIRNAYNSTYSAYYTTSSVTVPPYAPTHVEVEFSPATALMARVMWVNNSAADTAYEVDRSTDGGNTWTTLTSALPANSTTYTDATVTSSQAYEYRVEALSNGVSSTSVTTLSETASALPSLYAHGDIGDASTVGLAGSAGYNSSTSTYTLSGSGSDIWNTADGFQFAYTTLTGNGQIIADVTSISNTNSWAKAGLMFRNGTAVDATFADVVVTPGNGVSFQWRSTAGASCGYSQVSSVTAPVWLKLTRSGSQFSAYYSTNGTTWTQIGSSVTITMGTTSYVGMVACAHDNTQLATATFTNVALTGTGNAAPTVATAAAASQLPAPNAASANLSVLGADDAGEGNLIYTWATSGTPPAAVSFSSNGQNDSKNTAATFTKPGSYSFVVAITDQFGLSTTSTVNLTVNQTATSIAVSPSGATVTPNGTKQFSATVYDQFGAALSTQPTFTWSNTNVGSINSSGLYTAGTTQGISTVTATVGTVSGSATVNVSSLPAPLAWYRFDEGSGTTALDSSGNGYNGTISSSGATYGTGIASSDLQFDGSSGDVVIGNPSGLNVTGQITLSAWVNLPSIPSSGDQNIVGRSYGNNAETVLRLENGYYQIGSWNGTNYYASYAIPSGDVGKWVLLTGVYDGSTWRLYRNGTQVATQTASVGALNVSKNWVIGSGDGVGRYFPGSIDDVRIYNVGLSATQVSQLYNAYLPVVGTPTANPAPVTGTTTTLSVQGTSLYGSSVLSYTWSVTSKPSGAADPTFSVNGTNAASTTVATFTKAGTYTFQVTASESGGLTATSSVTVTVNQTLTSIAVTPATASVLLGNTQQFSAVGDDQFGNALSTQPTFTWTVASGVGSVNSSGLYSATALGSASVKAAYGGIGGTASVTVTDSVPTVATAASATPNPVTGLTAALSVLGADAAGESSLSYTWSAMSVPAGATVTYSANGTNAAKNATATFDMAGAYKLVATITNSSGASVTSTVSVTVSQTLSSIVVMPTYASMAAGAQQQFTAKGCDQFGEYMSSQPTVTWSVSSGGGSISSSGLYTAPSSTGAATVRATTGSLSGTASVAYSTPDVAWYKADESSGSTLADSTGNGKTASLSGSYSFGPGASGNAVNLTGGYASLPTGVVSGLNDFTIAAWVKLSSVVNWTRIFDFGTGTSNYMFLTPSAGDSGLPRFAITTGSGEQRIDSSTAISANVWTHVAVTLSGNTATLYINGTAVGTNTSMTIHPTALGSTNQNYIGKSQWSDPDLPGSIDDFRIYGRALSSTEIQAFQVSNTAPTVRIAAAASPGVVTGTATCLSVLGADNAGDANLTYTWSCSSTPSGASAPVIGDNGDNSAKVTVANFSHAGSYTFLATITDALGLSTTSSVSVTVNQTLTSVVVTPASAILATGAQQQFSAVANDQFGIAMSSQPTITWSVPSGGGSISSSGLYTASTTPGTATVSASAGSVAGTANVSVGIPDAAWYTANQSAGSTSLTDSSGKGNTATLTATYRFGPGISGNCLDLSGSGYASLPTGIVSGLNDFTIAGWVRMATPNWVRIFDFGTGTSNYMFLTPSAGGTNMPRFAITTGNGEQQINSSIAIPANTWTHVAVTLSGNTATLYINGVVAGTNTGMTIHPTALGSTTQNYIGRSQFSADPTLQGEVDDFRIYGRALGPAEIQPLAAMNVAAYWKLDDGNGTTAADSSGNSHTATLGGGASWTGGAVGTRAVSFNGTSTSVATVIGPVVDTAASFTVSAWVQLNSNSGFQTFVSNCGTNVAGYLLQCRGDTGTFALTMANADSTSSSSWVDSGVKPVLGQWYHLVGVANASANTISIYVNGVLENTASFSSWWSATGNTLIGHGFWNGAQTDYVNGAVDEIQIFPKALSATQVLGLHEAAAYNLNEESGTSAADATGHGNTLTLGSGVSWTTGWLGANALAFNGTSNGTATCANPVVNTAMPFSVSAWVNLSSTSTTQTFASIDGANVSAYCLQYRSDTGRFAFTRLSADSVTAQSYSVQSTSAPSTNYWYNLIGVNDVANGRLMLYVNGVLQGTLSYLGSWQATGATVLGADKFNGTRGDFASGAVDDVRFFGAAIGSEEAFAIGSAGRSSLNVDTTTTGITISPNLFGAFMEDINYGGDGGIYDNEVRNSGFNDSSNALNAWSAVTGSGVTATLSSDTTTGPTTALTMSGKLAVTSGVSSTARVGIANSGYFGVAVVPSTTYTGYFYAKATSGFTGSLTITLESTSGTVYATATVSAISTSWTKYAFTLTTGASTPSSTSNVFVISTTSASANGQTIWFGATYLFPPGYAGYNNGNNHFRTDLMQKLVAMKPAIFRVPGGNYLEGNDYADRFNWQATIGPLEDRPGHNDPWGYWSDDGFGLDDYLQMAEACGAQPILAIYAGYTLNGSSDTGQTLTDDVTSAVNELHYCLDPVTTTWGAMRAANGHPAPYNVNYVEIGNEDGFSSTYATRYPLFYNAIKAAFPNLKIIATGTNNGGYPYDVLDEHFYPSPQWFVNNSNNFDNQTRGSSSVFVGEYGAQEGALTPDLSAGIGDTAWIMGMMRNSDLVAMSSYAPLWINVNTPQWHWAPNLIGFDGLNSYGSFSYYAQVVLSNNHGTTVVSSSAGGDSGVQTLVSRTGSTYYITLLNTETTSDIETISLSGLQGLQPTGTAITLASWDGSTNNSLATPTSISPHTTSITGSSTTFSYTVPGQSLTVLEVDANTAPTVATNASTTASPVTGTITTLSVLGADDAGESNLTYTWSSTGPAAVNFSANGSNAAKNTTATFSKAGTYILQVLITDLGGLTTTSSVNVTVNQTLTSIAVSPTSVALGSHATQQFAATAYDQFAAAMSTQPSFTWALASGGGGIDTSSGLYTASYTSGVATVTAASGSVTSPAASVTVTDAAPTVATPAAASPSTVTGTAYALSVLGADSDGGGEANLSYMWSYTGPASVTFSPNGSNTAKNAIATLSQAGAYSFTVTITDLGGQSTASSVQVTISSQAQWNAAATASWNTLGSWTDSGATVAAPGVRGMAGDVALFAVAAGGTARLDGANPTLAGITFNNAVTSYTIDPGSGGSLTLQGSGGATVSVLSGSHTISAPVHLASNTTVNAAASSTLTMTGPIDGSAGLTMTGGGKLVLDAANSFSGGLIVQSGTVVLDVAGALPDGGSLTVGAPSAFKSAIVSAPVAALVASPATVSNPARSTTESLSPRAVAAVLARRPIGPPSPPWLRRVPAVVSTNNGDRYDEPFFPFILGANLR